jgi:hypothetical protein
MVEIVICNNLTEYIIASLNAYVKFGQFNTWFRGVNKSEFCLIPKIYRSPKKDATFFELEASLTEDYLVRSAPISCISPQNVWHQYAEMQHHGLPTRLLDWSRSPLVALFFALTGDGGHECAVWAISPFIFNEKMGGRAYVPVPGITRSVIDRYLPYPLIKSSNRMPIYPRAIEPTYTNRRIVAQQGCFTVHGSSSDNIENYPDANSYLIKIVISDTANNNELRSQLYFLGIRQDYIYQDLDSIAKTVNDARMAVFKW